MSDRLVKIELAAQKEVYIAQKIDKTQRLEKKSLTNE